MVLQNLRTGHSHPYRHFSTMTISYQRTFKIGLSILLETNHPMSILIYPRTGPTWTQPRILQCIPAVSRSFLTEFALRMRQSFRLNHELMMGTISRYQVMLFWLVPKDRRSMTTNEARGTSNLWARTIGMSNAQNKTRTYLMIFDDLVARKRLKL